MHGGKCGHGCVGDAVGEGAEADHDEDLDAVVLKDGCERFKALVFPNEPVYVLREDSAAGEEREEAPAYVCPGADEPAFHPVDEACYGEGRAVADDWGECRDEDERKADNPAAGEGSPFDGHGCECREEFFRVNYEEDAGGCEYQISGDEEDALCGTCGCPERESFSLEDLRILKKLVFKCGRCG